MDDYYGLLELNNDASLDEIKKSFRTLALKYHPDKNKNVGSKEKFMKIVEAYEVLSDTNGKKNYDESITIKMNSPKYDFDISWTPAADFEKVYSYTRIKNAYGGGGGIWDIGEKASKAMWKATIILLASLGTMALLIIFLP